MLKSKDTIINQLYTTTEVLPKLVTKPDDVLWGEIWQTTSIGSPHDMALLPLT